MLKKFSILSVLCALPLTCLAADYTRDGIVNDKPASGDPSWQSGTEGTNIADFSGSGDNVTISGNVWNNTNDVRNPVNTDWANNFNITLTSVKGNMNIDGNVVNWGGEVNLQSVGDIKITNGISGYKGTIVADAKGSFSADDIYLNEGEYIKLSGANSLKLGDVDILTGYGEFTTGSGFLIAKDIEIKSASPFNTKFSAANGMQAEDISISNSGNLEITVGTGKRLIADNILLYNGKLNFTSGKYLIVNNQIYIDGNIAIGAFGGSLNFSESDISISANTLSAVGLINGGNFKALIKGTTKINNIDNSGAQDSGSFSLTTKILETNSIDSLLSSRLRIFSLTLNGQGLSGTNILNGINALNDSSSNANASMNISASDAIAMTGNIVNVGANMSLVSGKNITIDGEVWNGTKDGTAVANANAEAIIDSGDILTIKQAVRNFGELELQGEKSIALLSISNSGTLQVLAIDSSVGKIDLTGLTTNSGDLTIKAYEIAMAGLLNESNSAGIVATGSLNLTGGITVSGGAAKFSAPAMDIAGGISQNAGSLELYANSLILKSGIAATNAAIKAYSSNGLTANIAGNVSGGVKFLGVDKISITGNYTFDNNSMLVVNQPNSVDYGNVNGEIITGGTAIIGVNGIFTTNLTHINGDDSAAVAALQNGQVGLVLTSMVDAGTAIKLLEASGGIKLAKDSQGNDTMKLRNVSAMFCNADGSICWNYLNSSMKAGGTDDLPIYLSVRDTNSDGTDDSVYIVFDPSLGGPVQVFKIQPIVAREPTYTVGEYEAAGALDNMIAGALKQKGFYERTPIEAIPIIFMNTKLEQTAKELYDRMEQYQSDRDTDYLARFSRLFQPREVEQITQQINLNEHLTRMEFETRMFDEFIWNRNRNLQKAWFDLNMTNFSHSGADDKTIDGGRFAAAVGFDWRHSRETIIGLSARVNISHSDNSDSIDLSYGRTSATGDVRTKVSDMDIGIGAYMEKNITNESRLYGNLFLDAHFIDVRRNQNFIDEIRGAGDAFSIASEWGLLHNIAEQYLVGNAYARIGYNFGFDVKEWGYMDLQSNGYLIITPGYSLVLQKRFYLSSWLQIRPNLSASAEYDLAGANDAIKYKFAVAENFSDYKLQLDPLWVNVGAGLEIIGVSGFQIGANYKYQYNAEITSHSVRVGGSYRF